MTDLTVASGAPEARERDRRREQIETLAALASDLAGEFALTPLLEHILMGAVELLGCESGSICTIDETARRYRKEVDLAVGCRSGEVFPLDEGVTGAVVRAAAPVQFRRYSSVPGGHISPDDSRYRRAVIGVPIRLRSTIIGACVVFARDESRVFDEADIQLLELFSIHAAVAITNSRLHTEAARGGPPRDPASAPDARLTAREVEVRALVELGWQDKLIAVRLGISPKTVEKHVGRILKKTGSHNRTELAARASRHP